MGIFRGRLNDPLRKTLRKLRRQEPDLAAEIKRVEGDDVLIGKLERHMEWATDNQQRQFMALALESESPKRGRVFLNWLWENRAEIIAFIRTLFAK